MPYRICKTFEVENAHLLTNHPDKCRFPHGHSRRIELVLESDTLNDNDMVCDFKVIKTSIREFINAFDHAMCINTDDPNFAKLKEMFGDRMFEFEKTDPTSEVIAKMIFDRCCQELEKYRDQPEPAYPLLPGVRLLKVRIWETETSWAEYTLE